MRQWIILVISGYVCERAFGYRWKFQLGRMILVVASATHQSHASSSTGAEFAACSKIHPTYTRLGLLGGGSR